MRRTYQNGWLELQPRKRGPSVWLLRFRERQPGEKVKKAHFIVGSVEEYPTESLAWRAAQHLKLAINADRPNARKLTFGAVVDRYIAEEMPERISTRRFYLPWLNNYIKPKWGSYPVADVRPFAVREWLKRLPLKKKSKQHIRSLMKQLFSCAMLWELIPIQENPMTLVRIPKSTENLVEKRVLKPEEFQALLGYLHEPFRTMVLVAGCLGLRVSEILGLQWGDIDWEQLEIYIRRAVVLGAVGDVKTTASRSRMPMDPSLAELLLGFKQRFAAPAGREDWIFANPSTGRPWRPSRIQQRYIRTAAVRAGIGDGIGWHNFRHTFSTLLRSFGTDVKVQQELLRHADVRTTLNLYTQAMSAQKREAVGKVIQLVLPKKQTA